MRRFADHRRLAGYATGVKPFAWSRHPNTDPSRFIDLKNLRGKNREPSKFRLFFFLLLVENTVFQWPLSIYVCSSYLQSALQRESLEIVKMELIRNDHDGWRNRTFIPRGRAVLWLKCWWRKKKKKDRRIIKQGFSKKKVYGSIRPTQNPFFVSRKFHSYPSIRSNRLG